MGAVGEKCPKHGVTMVARMVTIDEAKGVKREMLVCPEPGCTEKI